MAATRINTGFDEGTVAKIEVFMHKHGLTSKAEAVRALTVYALTEVPKDRAFTAAFEQLLADLRQISRALLVDLVPKVTEAVFAKMR